MVDVVPPVEVPVLVGVLTVVPPADDVELPVALVVEVPAPVAEVLADAEVPDPDEELPLHAASNVNSTQASVRSRPSNDIETRPHDGEACKLFTLWVQHNCRA